VFEPEVLGGAQGCAIPFQKRSVTLHRVRSSILLWFRRGFRAGAGAAFLTSTFLFIKKRSFLSAAAGLKKECFYAGRRSIIPMKKQVFSTYFHCINSVPESKALPV
jgi:hypothetical protein